MTRILVVDDSKFARSITTRALRAEGYEVLEAQDGAAGLEAVAAETPDCVVLDMLMPVVDGLEFLRRLRSSGSELPVVACSADVQSGTRRLCEELGVSSFLNKPARDDEICRAVARSLLSVQGRPTCD